MSQETECQRDDINVIVKQEPGCRVILDVTVSPSRAKKEYQQAIKAVNREVSLPGFRKGRAPDAMIVSRFASAVDSQWKEQLVQVSFEKGCSTSQRSPLGKEFIRRPKMENCSLDEGARLHFEFEHYPTIPAIQVSSLSVQSKPVRQISQKDVDYRIREVLEGHASWEEISSRPVQFGDFVDLDIESLDEPGKMLCSDKRFEVSTERMGKWMLDLVLGAELNAVLSGTSALDEKSGDEIKHFKPTKCRIKVNKILNISLPELDDELAKKVGSQDVADLFQRTEEHLKKQAVKEARESVRQDLEKQILDTHPFDLPATLVEQERRSRVKGQITKLKLSKESQESIKAKEGEIEAAAIQETDTSLRLFFLFRTYCEEHNLGVSEEELMTEMLQQYFRLGLLNGNQEPQIDREQFRARALSNCMADKAVDHILGQLNKS